MDGMEWHDRVISLPFFGQNTFKRHDVTLRETKGQHDGFSYDPSYDPMKEDSPKIVQLKPSWLATAMFSLGEGKQRFEEHVKIFTNRTGQKWEETSFGSGCFRKRKK